MNVPDTTKFKILRKNFFFNKKKTHKISVLFCSLTLSCSGQVMLSKINRVSNFWDKDKLVASEWCYPCSLSQTACNQGFFVVVVVDNVLLVSGVQHNEVDNVTHYSVLTMLSVVPICHHTMLLFYYWLYSLCCTFHLCV